MKKLSLILLALMAFGTMAWAQQRTFERVTSGQVDWSGNYLMGLSVESMPFIFSGGFLSEIPDVLSNTQGFHIGESALDVKWVDDGDHRRYLINNFGEASLLIISKSSYDPLHYSIQLGGSTNSSKYLYVGEHGLEVSAIEPVNHFWNFTSTPAGVKMFDPNIGDDYTLYALLYYEEIAGGLSDHFGVVYYMDYSELYNDGTFQDHDDEWGNSYTYSYWYPNFYKDTSSGNASEPLGEVATPYSFGFEDAGEMVNYWTTKYSLYTEGKAFFGGLVDLSTDNPRNGRYSLKFFYVPASLEESYLISPKLTGDHPNGIHVEFYYSSLLEEFDEYFTVGYSLTGTNTDEIDGDFFYPGGVYHTNSPNYQRFSYDFPPGTKYVAIRCLYNPQQYALYIDDILFRETSSCPEPHILEANGVTSTSATINWEAGSEETQWDLYYSSLASDVPDETTTPIRSGLTTTSCNLTGLTSGTTYYVYVRGLCSQTETGDWSMPYTFDTDCVDIALPYSCDFSAISLPLCWNYLSSNNTVNDFYIVPEDDGVTGSCLSFVLLNAAEELVAVLPKVDANYPLNRFQVSFKAAWLGLNNNTQGALHIGYMDNPDEISTFHGIEGAGVVITNIYTDSDPSHNYQTYTISLRNFSGDSQYLAIKNFGYPGIVFIDDLEVTAPHILPITGYDNEVNSGSWNLIASPAGTVSFNDVINLRSNNYALYRFNQAAELEWENSKAMDDNNQPLHSDFISLESGRGYLYANNQDVALVFPNTPYNGTGTINLQYSTDNPSEGMRGWNLIGNPFVTAATIDKPFFRMNEGGTALSTQVEANNTVAAMEGVFVQATQAGQTAVFTQVSNGKGSEKSEVPMLNLNVSSNQGEFLANAIVRFDNGETLGAFSLHEDDSKLYITQDGKGYAVVRSNGQDEIPVSFKAKSDGQYTLTVNPEDVEMNYLHLIDNMTGADIDLLQTPSYTFASKTTDYSSRFKLVFNANNASTGSASDETFAYISDGNIIVTDGPSTGSGTLQVVDVMGRIIVSTDVARNVSTSGMPAGMYVLRLINDNDVKTQKIIIK